MAKLKSRRRKIGEICTRRDAIRNHCMECMGYQIAEIKRCTAKECWLFPFRPGATRAEINTEREEAGLKPVERKKKTLLHYHLPEEKGNILLGNVKILPAKKIEETNEEKPEQTK